MLFLSQHSNLFRDLLFLRLYIFINTCEPRIHTENIKGLRDFLGQGRISRKRTQSNLHYIDPVRNLLKLAHEKAPQMIVLLWFIFICLIFVTNQFDNLENQGKSLKNYLGRGILSLLLIPGYAPDILHIYVSKQNLVDQIIHS